MPRKILKISYKKVLPNGNFTYIGFFPPPLHQICKLSPFFLTILSFVSLAYWWWSFRRFCLFHFILCMRSYPILVPGVLCQRKSVTSPARYNQILSWHASLILWFFFVLFSIYHMHVGHYLCLAFIFSLSWHQMIYYVLEANFEEVGFLSLLSIWNLNSGILYAVH